MSFARLAFSSDGVHPLSALQPGTRGTIVAVASRRSDRVERLLSLGVTFGAPVTLLQVFPSVVLRCDQTELVVERTVADMILVRID